MGILASCCMRQRLQLLLKCVLALLLLLSGKTTFLRVLAAGEIKGLPPNCQVLHVEQEVVGDDSSVMQVGGRGGGTHSRGRKGQHCTLHARQCCCIMQGSCLLALLWGQRQHMARHHLVRRLCACDAMQPKQAQQHGSGF